MKCALCDRPGITEGDEALGLCELHDAGFRAEARETLERLKANPDDAEAEKMARSIVNNRIRLVSRYMMGTLPDRDLDFTAPDLFKKLRARAKERARQQEQQAHEQHTGQPGILEDYSE